VSIRSFLSSTKTNTRRAGFFATFQQIRYGGGAYVAVGVNGGSYAGPFTGAIRSSDGSNWSEHDLGISGATLAKTNTLWGSFAPSNGQVSTSPDGITWTPAAGPFTGGRWLTATQLRFVAIMNDSSIYFDSDLRGTNAGTATIPGRLGDIQMARAHPTNGSVVVAGGRDFAISSNLTTWTRTTPPWNATFGAAAAIGFVGTTVLVSVSPTNGVYEIWRSPDSGGTWSRVWSATNRAEQSDDFAFNGTHWVGSCVGNYVWASSTGENWVKIGLDSRGFRVATNGTDFVHLSNQGPTRFSLASSVDRIG
jgi:hypothetical protein